MKNKPTKPMRAYSPSNELDTTNPPQGKRAGGRPTKYEGKKTIQALMDYFDVEPYEEREVSTVDKQGRVTTAFVKDPVDLPTLAGFAKKLKVDRDTIKEWAKVHSEFSAAIKIAKECTQHILVTNGLLGLYAPAMSVFTAKNICKQDEDLEERWTDRQDITSKGDKIGDVVIKFVQHTDKPITSESDIKDE